MTNQASNRVRDDPVSSTTSGTQMQQWTADGGANQQWVFTYDGNGYYTIQNVASGLYLTDPNGSTSNGAQLQQQTADNLDDQLWALVWTGRGFVLINKAGRLAMDDPSFSTTVGKRIDLWAYNGGLNQQWQIA
jgi:glucosylceramidase